MTNKSPHTKTVSINYTDQRLDNYLFRELKRAPKSLVYRLIRKGHIRVNNKRTKPEYKLILNDVIKLPRLEDVTNIDQNIDELINDNHINNLVNRIIYECDDFLIINKPQGVAVHAGSNIKFGIIDILRKYYTAKSDKDINIELVHRLDRDTSGCLLLSKSRVALKYLNLQLTQHEINKTYLALVDGIWQNKKANNKFVIEHPLRRSAVQSGERMVVVDQELGKTAITEVKIKASKDNTSLLELTAVTGRTHQLRVHLAHEQHPILGDAKYGNKNSNKEVKSKAGLKRIFLHAYKLEFKYNNKLVSVTAPLDKDLESTLEYLEYFEY